MLETAVERVRSKTTGRRAESQRFRMRSASAPQSVIDVSTPGQESAPGERRQSASLLAGSRRTGSGSPGSGADAAASGASK